MPTDLPATTRRRLMGVRDSGSWTGRAGVTGARGPTIGAKCIQCRELIPLDDRYSKGGVCNICRFENAIEQEEATARLRRQALNGELRGTRL